MKAVLFVIFILFSVVWGHAQKSVASLDPAHALTLEGFLSKNKNLNFMSERLFDKETLEFVRKHVRANLTPYYIKGDFNKDKIQDFGVILMNDVRPQKDPDLSEPHNLIYTLTIAIFNGSKNGTYKNAFTKQIEVPLVCFLNVEEKQLYFGVAESDAHTFIMTPAGKGYIVEFPEEP